MGLICNLVSIEDYSLKTKTETTYIVFKTYRPRLWLQDKTQTGKSWFHHITVEF